MNATAKNQGRPGDDGLWQRQDGYLARLTKAEGLTRGLQRRVDSDTHYIEILTQVSRRDQGAAGGRPRLLTD